MQIQVSQLILSQQNAYGLPLHKVIFPSTDSSQKKKSGQTCMDHTGPKFTLWKFQRGCKEGAQSPHTHLPEPSSLPIILFLLPSFRGWKIRSKQHCSDSESWALLEPEAVVSQLRMLPYCGCRMQLRATKPWNTYKIKLTENPNGQSVDFFLALKNRPSSVLQPGGDKEAQHGDGDLSDAQVAQVKSADGKILTTQRIMENQLQAGTSSLKVSSFWGCIFHLLSLSTIDCNWVIPQFPRQCPTSRLQPEKSKAKFRSLHFLDQKQTSPNLSSIESWTGMTRIRPLLSPRL